MKAKTVLSGLLLCTILIAVGQSGQDDVSDQTKLSAQTDVSERADPSNQTDSSTQSETEKVEAAVNELFAAMVEKNTEALRELTAEQLDYGHSSGTLENKSQFIDAVMKGGFDYISIEPEQQQITLSGDTAIVRHIFVSKGTNNGEPTDVRIGNLMTFQKQNGDWKLLARQAYKL